MQTRSEQKSSQSIAKFRLSARLPSPANANQLLINLGLAALVVLTGACSSLPKPSSTVKGTAGSAEGQWRGKALVKNLKTKKSGTIDLDLLAHEPDRLRIEALGPLSVHVASVAAKGNEVRISMTREKKFVIAPADRNSLSRIVPVRVSPADLLALLFNRPLDAGNSGWKCDQSTEPTWTCESGKAKIERQKDEDGRRKFKFTAPDAEMGLVLSEAPVNTDLGDSAYLLEPTTGYTVEDRR